MNTHDLALVIYTILAQMSVGAFVILGLIHFYAERKAGEAGACEMSDRALFAIGPVLVLGVIASFFHLGTPTNAYRAVNNVDSSWLSREILFTLLFTGTGAVFAVMQYRKISTCQVRRVVALVAAVLGIALVFIMSSVYRLEAEPAWNTIATPIAFYTTTFLLGGLALGVAFVVNYNYLKSKKTSENIETQSEMLRTVLQWIAIGSVVLLGLELVVMPLYISHLSAGNTAAVESASKLTNDYGVILALRLILVIVGAGLFGMFLYQNAVLSKERKMAYFAYAAFALVLIAEVLGRALFYAIRVRMGI